MTSLDLQQWESSDVTKQEAIVVLLIKVMTGPPGFRHVLNWTIPMRNVSHFTVEVMISLFQFRVYNLRHDRGITFSLLVSKTAPVRVSDDQLMSINTRRNTTDAVIRRL